MAAAQTSVCQSWRCGAVFEGLDRHCPTCGNVAVPQKRIRRMGGVLVALGLFLVGLMGTVTYYTAPLMLGAGEAGGARFDGSAEDATVILAIFALVIAFGLVAIVVGALQMVRGRQNWRIVIGMLVLVGALCWLVWLVNEGFLLRR